MTTVSRTKEFTLPKPVELVFPLFTPEGEKLWVPDWDYETVSEAPNICEDYVFLTKAHDHASADAIWIVKKYDPETHFVQYYRIEPEQRIGVVTVCCDRLSNISTRVQVTYAYTGLSKSGEAFIKGFSDEYFRNYIEEWERLLYEYITSTGKSTEPENTSTRADDARMG